MNEVIKDSAEPKTKAPSEQVTGEASKNLKKTFQPGITPSKITSLKKDQVFVFGSNLEGKHSGGAAEDAMKSGWAEAGKKEGLQHGDKGESYAIPTCHRPVNGKDDLFKNVDEMEPYVKKFLDFAKQHPEKQFLLTPIGTGVAGFSAEKVAPLFAGAENLKNVTLPQSFVDELVKDKAQDSSLKTQDSEKQALDVGGKSNKEASPSQETSAKESPSKEASAKEAPSKEAPSSKKEQPKNAPGEIKVGVIGEKTGKPSVEKTEKPMGEKAEKPTVEKTEKKPTVLSKDPVQWVAGSVTGIVGGAGMAVSRAPAKIMDIVADPLQLFTKQFWKDFGFNTKKSLKNTGKTLTSGFRKTDTYESVNTQKSYAKSWGRNATKNDPWYKKLVKRPLWLAGKSVKIPARGIQMGLNFIGDTFDGIRKKKRKGNPFKWQWNPFKWKFKDYDYSRTKRSWKKLTSRDEKKTESGKVVSLVAEDKRDKAA